MRSDAKSESDVRLAAELANSALLTQRRRHNHEGGCPVCLQVETRRAA
jgi:hypothetical protein